MFASSCVLRQRGRVDTLCILPLLNALFAARWERDYYEADEEIMRDGKWIRHKPHDMGGNYPLVGLYQDRTKKEANNYAAH